jgi:hypothetical protein
VDIAVELRPATAAQIQDYAAYEALETGRTYRSEALKLSLDLTEIGRP